MRVCKVRDFYLCFRFRKNSEVIYFWLISTDQKSTAKLRDLFKTWV